MDANAENFLHFYRERIKRDGADKLLEWLLASDFFTAPASTKYHLSRQGGLCKHSTLVYERLCRLVTIENDHDGARSDFNKVSVETLAICGLLHDVCKVDFYKEDKRNVKDANGQWVQVPYYTVDDKLPYGHGEKSVYIISGFMHLNREEAFAIRWHMGSYGSSVGDSSYSMYAAFDQYPLAVLLHLADMQAAYLDERKCDKSCPL